MPSTRLPGAVRARLAAALANPTPRTSPEELRGAVADRVVVVTGASQGIGRAVATALAQADAHVLMVARSADVLEELATDLGPRAHAFPCDLAQPDRARALASSLIGECGHVDIVVSNAGKSIRRAVADSYDRMHDITRTTAINYHGPVELLLGLLGPMRARGEGHVVNVSTVGALLAPAPRWGPYVASKSAFDIWLRAAVAETAADGVTATSLYLGLVHTAMSAPTTDFRAFPGIGPDEAAQLVADAIVLRPPMIAPWWARAAGVASLVAPRAAGRAASHYGRSVGSGRGPR